MSAEQFLTRAAGERFRSGTGPASPERQREVAMFLNGRWQTIVLGEPPATATPADRLDVTRLQDERA